MSLLVDSSFTAYWVTLQVQAWNMYPKLLLGPLIVLKKITGHTQTPRQPHFTFYAFQALWLTGPLLDLWATGLLNKTLLWEVLCSPGYGRSDISVVQDNASLHKNMHAHKWAAPLIPLAKALDGLVEAGSFATVESSLYAPQKFSVPPRYPAGPWKRWAGSLVQIKSQMDSTVGMVV